MRKASSAEALMASGPGCGVGPEQTEKVWINPEFHELAPWALHSYGKVDRETLWRSFQLKDTTNCDHLWPRPGIIEPESTVKYSVQYQSTCDFPESEVVCSSGLAGQWQSWDGVWLPVQGFYDSASLDELCVAPGLWCQHTTIYYILSNSAHRNVRTLTAYSLGPLMHHLLVKADDGLLTQYSGEHPD